MSSPHDRYQSAHDRSRVWQKPAVSMPRQQRPLYVSDDDFWANFWPRTDGDRAVVRVLTFILIAEALLLAWLIYRR